MGDRAGTAVSKPDSSVPSGPQISLLHPNRPCRFRYYDSGFPHILTISLSMGPPTSLLASHVRALAYPARRAMSLGLSKPNRPSSGPPVIRAFSHEAGTGSEPLAATVGSPNPNGRPRASYRAHPAYQHFRNGHCVI